MKGHTTPVVKGALPFRHQQKRRAQKAAAKTGDVSAQNFAATDYTQDYVLLFQCGNPRTAPVNRLDFTLVPKIKRDSKVREKWADEGRVKGMRRLAM